MWNYTKKRKVQSTTIDLGTSIADRAVADNSDKQSTDDSNGEDLQIDI